MPFSGAEAVDYDYLPEPEARALELTPHEGRGLDRRERQALDPVWRRVFKVFVVCAAIMAALGVLRVQMTVWCVESLSANAELRAEAHEAEEDARAFAVEESVLSSADRIERIATQNLGMVYVGEGEPLEVPVG